MRWSASACGSGFQNVRFYLSTTDRRRGESGLTWVEKIS